MTASFHRRVGDKQLCVIIITGGFSQARDVVGNFVEVSRQPFRLDAQFCAHQNSNKKFSQFSSDEAVFTAGIRPHASRHIVTPVEKDRVRREVNSVDLTKENHSGEVDDHADHLQDVDGISWPERSFGRHACR